MYLKLHPYRMQSLATRTNQKLAAPFYGPFEVLERIGVMAYKSQLPKTSKTHPVFHVSLLKRSVGSFTSRQLLPSDLSAEAELLIQPKQILHNKKNAKGELDILVK